MSNITLTVPDEVYERIREIATATAQPIEELLVKHLQSSFAPNLPTLAPDEEAELIALQQLSDDTLWTIAREKLPQAVQRRMETLMTENSNGDITQTDYHELERLVERGDRLMVRKAEAAAILRQRGYTVTPKELTDNNA